MNDQGEVPLKKIQEVIDNLGTVRGVIEVLLVSEEGYPITSTGNLPISDEVQEMASSLVTKITDNFADLCFRLGLGDPMEIILVQTSKCLGIISKIENKFLILITYPGVSLGLIQSHINTTKVKFLRLKDNL